MRISEVTPLKYKIGTQIRKFRKARGLSQKRLAEELCIGTTRISNWEQGLNRPDADMIGDICRVLKVSPSELLDVHLSEDDFSQKEKALIYAYRDKPELRRAIDILMDLDEN